MANVKKINKVLVANRGEIAIRVFRACTELNIRTVAIYSQEDTGSYHRYKADEAYLIGEGKKPIDAYLDIEGIIEIAKSVDVDAIHPGYGFLSENIQFARRCEEEGITFIGPTSEHLNMFGDKVKARDQAVQADIPVIPGSDGPVSGLDEIREFGDQHGYPLMIKAAMGGGGRGMRVVRSAATLEESYDRARSEAQAAFGSDEVYVEKLIEEPKHIEVQIIGDMDGEIVHLYERDCSVQRRHQKVVEIAPSVSLNDEVREAICQAAVKLMDNVKYINAGTVEFLVTGDEFYFIEVNPRVQVEHTITEMITGVDIVQTQILVAQGYGLHSGRIGIPTQKDIYTHGYAIQSRVTTEDPLNNFMPDTGKIMAYRSGGGFGVRLDAGNGFQGAVISPYYDSLLVKLSTWALSFDQAAHKMVRNLKEFRIRGIKTNIPFLENVVQHKQFLSGEYDTTFIDRSPELFVFPKRKDRGTKMLSYIADRTINGFEGYGNRKKPTYSKPRIPDIKHSAPMPEGTKQILDERGPEGLAKWVKERHEVLLTDTTFRDAHQSLLATRVRTKDLENIAEPTARLLPELFSLEMWGGATFDVSYRFLNEDPWERLLKLRTKAPNVLFQMLLRASNAVGYKNYPDNVIREFVEKSASAGIDVFRIFDSLNWVEGMKLAIDSVRESGKVAEASMCYTGDILDTGRPKYNLAYYKQLAMELQDAGAHILGIKDMAGLMKPEAAFQLISTLKETIDIPIHLHTHDTSGNGLFTYAKAIEAGVDVVDVATGSMAGLTSQPSANSLYYALEGSERKPNVDIQAYEELGHFWEDTRKYYQDFESGMVSPHTEVYEHEMPGGQYSNLQQQAKAVGLGHRWDEVKAMYRRVNDMFGDIVKVTPSSKIVGDMALYMVQNDLNEDDIYEKGESLDFPDSVVEFFQGYLGQPYGGFPAELQRIILKGREPISVRPGELLEPVDFNNLKETLFHSLNRQVTSFDMISYALYPKVFMDHHKFCEQYGDMSVLDTPTFFYGMRLGEEIEVEIEQGKTLIVKLVSVGEPQIDGTRTVYFELNGQPREVVVKDENVKATVQQRPKADKSNNRHIGATMPGTVIKVLTTKGEKVKKGDHLMITEAMKMETTVQAPFDGVIKDVYVDNNEAIHVGDLLLEFE
ncbi:pyruvate carboxylase [Halobacillus karajensis]|uniref:Pyruvate carboxylase n=1 Tax=Halobacillus karajensis TaxID=195088 RepID=A0A024P349_9BACI|nr:pyruvate carboxylase [Halobacillus karajensis]CDQ19881.1 2-oxoglutarate carboxylase small subunit [Halobacillus karajensis]CDQ22341.1 2-oxoglutarate carboxylase small subunit [Halobacillus karajensis]CDQ28182.1 2-oxoglutarate carboxylase small subunit [Halobacillus karajensis]